MNQPKPLAVFDVDGTLFKSSLLEKVVKHCFEVGLFNLADFAEVAKLRRKWQLHNTEQDYLRYIEKLIKEFVAHIEGVDVHVFDWVTKNMVADHGVRLFAFPRQLMESVRESHTLVIISGSPEIVVRPFVEQFSVDYVFGSTFEQMDGKYTGVGSSVGDKAAILQRLVDQGKGLQADSVAIGDTVSDISMLSFVETPIMFNASQTLTEYGKKLGWLRVNEVKDSITALQYREVVGYREINPKELIQLEKRRQRLITK